MIAQKGNILSFVLVILAIAAGVTGLFWWRSTAQTPQKACTLEAKLCPDGSYVGRSGPNCEFAACPTSTNQTANWQTYTVVTEPSLGLINYQISLPQGWWRIEHSSNFQKTETFQDTHTPGNFTYQLIITQEKNINEKTGQPFTDLQSLTGFPYEVPILTVAGQQAIQVLPHAGSEMNYKVLFFSRDTKIIVSIELDTPRDGSKAEEGKKLFDQILSTFKFLDQNVSGKCGVCGPQGIHNVNGATCTAGV